MASPIEQAIRQICEEKGLTFEAVIETIESALSAAYRKDFGEKNQNIEVEFDPTTADTKIFDVKTVVEDVDLEELERLEEERREKAEASALAMAEAREKGESVSTVSKDGEEEEEEEVLHFNPKTDIMFSDAQVLKSGSQLGDIIRSELPLTGEFGRMAAMTAKQVITQRLREAEREIIFNEFKEQEGEVINATVQRREGRVILIDLGRVTAVMRPEDQISTERYASGDRIQIFVKQVSLTTKGPEILVSRTSEELVRRMFEVEIPEIAENVVEIKALAREAGSRTKIAVSTEDESIDPIGACIGQRGTRIQTIIMALGGEKIDIIEWSEDPVVFISNALSPAKVHETELRESDKSAVVRVEPDQLSLAIGKGGQNVRLAAQLTGWKININGGEIQAKDEDGEEVEGSATEEEKVPEEVSVEAPDLEEEVIAVEDEDVAAEEESEEVVEDIQEEPQSDVDQPSDESIEEIKEAPEEESEEKAE